MTVPAESPNPARRRPSLVAQALPWLITLVCFAYLYTRLAAAAGEQGLGPYLLNVFQRVNWIQWLALMIPYSAFFFLIDSLVVWRVINWFNAKVSFGDILPIRASTYILSIVNEQVGKGAMAVYLNRRDGVPGWQVGSSMLFIMFCEFFYLCAWATIGVVMRWEHFPEVFHAIPYVLLGSLVFFALWVAFFNGVFSFGKGLRSRHILQSFTKAHVWQYATIVILRSPALLSAVVVYTLALRLFGVQAEFLDLLGYLPVIFFGAATPGPMRSVAIVLWVTLFPDNEGEMATFGLVQHNFFIFFNAAIGLLFLRRANRELLGSETVKG